MSIQKPKDRRFVVVDVEDIKSLYSTTSAATLDKLEKSIIESPSISDVEIIEICGRLLEVISAKGIGEDMLGQKLYSVLEGHCSKIIRKGI